MFLQSTKQPDPQYEEVDNPKQEYEDVVHPIPGTSLTHYLLVTAIYSIGRAD